MEIIWSTSRIETFEECPKRESFLYQSKIPRKQFLTFGPFVMGSILHGFLENYTIDGKPRVRYKSAESLGGALKGLWYHTIKDDFFRNQKIDWAYEKERFVLADKIKKIGMTLFERLKNEEPPIYSEFEFGRNPLINIRHNNHYHLFRGKIDQIRGNLTLRDFKSSPAHPGEVQLHHDISFTIYALAFCTLAHIDENFRRKVGVSDEDASRWGGKEVFIDEKVNIEWHSLGSDKIFTTRRSDKNLVDLLEKVDEVEERLRNYIDMRYFPPIVSRHCKGCAAKLQCSEYLSSAEPRPVSIQLQMPFTIIEEKIPTHPKPREKTKRFRFAE